MWFWFLCVAAAAYSVDGAGPGAARLVCYVESARASDFAECTHLVYTGDARGDKLDSLLKEYRKNNPKLKIVLRVSENDKDLRSLVKSKHVQGLEIHDAHRTLNKTKVVDMVDSARATISSSGGGPLFLALPAHPELLAKYYDLRNLVKKSDLMMVQTHALGLVKKMTYHPSRLSGLWDMMNTDSVVDLVVGLGVPASKLVISLPATARQFKLQNETLSTPGSPTEEDDPKEIDQAELCRQLRKGRWTLERDQDLSAPYAFKDKTWISFEDASSVDVKGKYARVRGLAGLALHAAERDADTPCGPTLKQALSKVLNQQSRAPRAAVLRSLENEILSAPSRALEALQVSPYRITQVVDSDGVIHSIREDTRTEFSCSRQGYFVHPRSCARFYRCVKFDQLSPDFTVFEFDCPAGLAFDARYEVCVWPGSLPHANACPGSSEIAPVPRTRYVCPEHEGYYADPENCRWFFACLDHGKAPLTAYEFRCPFGLGFDAARLKCDWPWLVPACGNIARYEAEAYGFSAATLTGAAGFRGQTADSVNIAAHQSLVSGAALDNLVGIQGSFLSNADALDANFIASQEYSPEASGQIYRTETTAPGFSTAGISYNVEAESNADAGLVQATRYDDDGQYSSGSLILDDYRLPAASSANANRVSVGSGEYAQANTATSASYSRTTSGRKYQTGKYVKDNSGRYVHNPAGDRALPYKHVDSPVKPYLHDADRYKYTQSYDVGKYKQDSSSTKSGGYYYPKPSTPFEDGFAFGVGDSQYQSQGYSDSGSSGGYVDVTANGGYQSGYSGSTSHGNTGNLYKLEGYIGSFGEGGVADNSGINVQQYNSYSNADVGNYVTDSKAYTGAAHTLTAGAINVGLVGKTSLVDADYIDQGNYQSGHEIVHDNVQGGQVSYVAEPAVSISHVGTDSHNLDGFSYGTTPTSSGVPTTATPFAVTTSLPVVTSYKTTYVPVEPKTSVKQVFGYTQPAVTYVQPTVVAVKHEYVTPRVEITDNGQGSNYQYESHDYTASNTYNAGSTKESQSTGYVYSQPSTKFEDGISYSTPSPAISIATYKPRGFSHGQQTVHKVESTGYEYSNPTPVTEVPFRKAVAYTTGAPIPTYVQPTESTYTPQSYSHQTIHKVESSNAYSPSVEVSGFDIGSSGVTYEEPQTVVHYTTARPTVAVQPVVTFGSSTPQPVVYSQQTLHQVDTSKITTYSEDDSATGYEYNKPNIQFHEGANSGYQYSTPAPAVTSTYRTPSYSHQTIHKVETPRIVSSSTPVPSTHNEYSYQTTPVTVYENPFLKYTQKVTPVSYSQQTIHQVDTSQTDTESTGYEYTKPRVRYERPKVVQYTTPQPTIAVQPAISTYEPQSYSQQTIHKVDASQVNTYSQGGESGYEYSQPSVKFVEASGIEASTPRPVVSTYAPHSYSQQTIHKVERQKYIPVSTTAVPIVDVAYQQPEVTVYENPILKYTQNTPTLSVRPTAEVFTQTYKPLRTKLTRPTQESYSEINQGYTYSQPEIQINLEESKPAYSDASVVSHQVFHQSHDVGQSDAGKNVVFVSTTPSTLLYESHYTDYESPKTVETYKAPEYIPPKTEYQQTYSVSTAAPVIYQSSVSHDTQEEYKPSYTKSFEIPNKVESIHFSSFPATVTTKYNQYESPEIQVGYKAEEYLPPVSSTARPVTSTYRPRYSTSATREYLPPTPQPKFNAPEYLPPAENTYLPPVENTYQPAAENTYLPPAENTYLPPAEKTYLPPTDNTYLPPVDNTYLPPSPTPESLEYLPPARKTGSSIVNFESFGYNNNGESYDSKIGYNPYEEKGQTYYAETVSSTAAPIQRKQNIVVETAKSQLLGFGTVGPDAGLVSPVSYTTAAPIYVSSSDNSYLPPRIVTSTYAPEIEVSSPVSRRTRPKYRPFAKSTTQEPIYYESTTKYTAPEYLPPSEETDQPIYKKYQVFNSDDSFVSSTAAPYQRKQNIVVETAKSQLGFGSVGSDAGLVSISTPIESYSSTYAPIKQELVEVTPTTSSFRRTKPKVAVVTKINDFNPLLVRKLGAVCSCQSPTLVLKGRRPTVQTESYDYDDSNRGDLGDDSWTQKSARFPITSTVVTPTPIVTSTFNPIIVPDDSFYQDYQEASNNNVDIISNGEAHPITYVSNTPVISTTEKLVRIRPRVKAVTAAPTYKTVLLNQEVTPSTIVKASEASVAVDSQSFDRYGPGGWRSRDETLQGTVDCKRAGLFRHPKQCNKFYACRWDCTKQRFTLHVFNCPVQLSFDPNLGACNWPSQGPACQGDTLLTNTL
ncbi:uncharacterized protein [Epargyreus clarus]|uniref:uncharacterized protein n=1 Tax=Epargyreus clarus TaxID=520877 RepID=UPI003C2B5E67